MNVSASFSAPYAAPGKLNLMLRVVGRRADGYHLLQTVFRLIDYGDTLRFRVTADGVIARLTEIEGVPAESDLCVRAARLLQQVTGTTLGADIQLKKRLPLGGGLGGGSSDAATTLLALNQLWKTAVPRTQLLDLSVKLGADVPIFVFGKNALAEGIGEQLRALELPPAWYVVLCPPVEVSTSAVFGHPDLKRDSKKVTIQGFSSAISGVSSSDYFVNDLQALVVRQYPEVACYLAWLSGHAVASKAQMTGSGACVFASFDTEAEAQRVIAQLPADMKGFVAQGLQSHPLHALGDAIQ